MTRVRIFKHIFWWKKSSDFDSIAAKTPNFEVLEPRVMLSADSLGCLNSSLDFVSLANDSQPVIEYSLLPDINHETNVQIQEVDSSQSKPAECNLTSENLPNENVILISSNDNIDEPSNVATEITQCCPASTVEINISNNQTELIIPLITFHKGRMPISNSDADLSIQYATSIEPRAPPA
jgi:hypothetical protein